MTNLFNPGKIQTFHIILDSDILANILCMFRNGSEKSRNIFMDFTGRVHNDEGDKGDIILLADCLALLFFHILSNVSNLILETRWDNSFVFFHLVIIEQNSFPDTLPSNGQQIARSRARVFRVMLTMKRASGLGWQFVHRCGS